MRMSIIEKSIDDAILKCGRTLNDMKIELANIPDTEKEESLKTIISDNQYENYVNKKSELYADERFKELLNDTNTKHISEKLDENITDLKEEIFQEERKIIETNNAVLSNINFEDFREEDTSEYKKDKLYIGDIEREYVALQEKKCDFTNEKDDLDSYFGSSYLYINGMLYGSKKWKKLCKDYPEDKKNWLSKKKNILKNIDNAINKTPGLPEPTMVYYSGKISNRKKVGDNVKFKGYLSTTFVKDYAKEWKDYSKDDVLIRFLLPSGTKGLARNSKKFLGSEYDWEATAREEHELLLGRGKQGKIVESPDGILTILLEG